MALKLYDLAGADDACRFSPHCWRTRMALAHKGLEVETVPWRFTEKDEIAPSGQGAVPVLVDGDTWINESWDIANYLEETYPERPSLFGGGAGRALSAFHNNWAAASAHPALVPLIITDLFARLDDKDKAYFRESREARFGRTLEEVGADRETKHQAFLKLVHPLRMTLRAQLFLGGEAPLYPDYVVFGMFMWARSTSPFQLLESDDPMYDWRERLLDAHDGLARSALAAT